MKRLCLNIMIHLSYQCYTRSADTIKSVYGNIFQLMVWILIIVIKIC